MRLNKTARILASVAALGIVAAACGDDDSSSAEATTEATAGEGATEDAEEMDETEAQDIVATASAAGDFTTLVAAVEAAGLVETLQGDGPFTVFAPSDEAFAAALEDLDLTAEELLADTDTLSSILTYHVVADEIPAAAAVEVAPADVETVNGASISVTTDEDGNVMVDEARVVTADIDASNGVIHVIDGVLLPPS